MNATTTDAYLNISANQETLNFSIDGNKVLTTENSGVSDLSQNHVKLAFVYVLYICIGVTGILSNAFVIFVIAKTPSMRKRFSNWFVTNLSVTDAIASVLVIINTLKIQFRGSYYGVLGYLRCHLITGEYLLFFMFTVSTYNLAVIAIERFLGVVHPIFHRNHFGKKVAITAMLAPWVLGLIINIPIGMNVKDGNCHFSYLETKVEQISLGIYALLGQFLFPVGIMIFCYAKMGNAMRKIGMVGSDKLPTMARGQPEGGRADGPQGELIPKSQRNVLKTLIILCAVYVVCGVQNHVAFFLYNMGYDGVGFGSTYNHFTIVCINLNCAVNPFVYAFNYDQFKKGMRRMFGGQVPADDHASNTRATNRADV